MNAIYVRVSTDEQAKSGYSLISQIDATRRKLMELGIFADIEEFIDDGYSGAFLERPALERLRSRLREKKLSAIAVFDPDRLARDLEHLLLLEGEISRSGAALHFVTGDYDASAVGKLFFAIRGAFAAYERAVIRERTTRGRKAKALQGKIVINAHPFGYAWDNTTSLYIIDEQQAQVVRLIYDLFLKNELSCRAITAELAQKGIIGPKGRPLSITTINRILGREMYCGTHYLFRQQIKKIGQNQREIINLPPEEWIPIQIPPIISRMQWQQAQSRLAANKRNARRNTKNFYMLQGLIRCALCGRSLIGVTRAGAPRKKPSEHPKLYSYYTCITKESGKYALDGTRCHCMRIPVKEFDEIVWETLVSLVLHHLQLKTPASQTEFDYTSEILRRKTQVQKFKKRHAALARLIRDGLLLADAAASELKALNHEIQFLETSIRELTAVQEKNADIPQSAPIDRWLAALAPEDRRRILQLSGIEIYAVRNSEETKFYYKLKNQEPPS